MDSQCSPKKRILLVSYFCPSRAHAGGLRILDIYSLIKAYYKAVHITLYTRKQANIDWSYDDIEHIFDSIVDAHTNDLTLRNFIMLNNSVCRYDVIDFQFHQDPYDMASWRNLGDKIIFTPMESFVRGALIALRTRDVFSLKKMLTHVMLAKKEVVLCRKADEIVCVSSNDAACLKIFLPSRKICALETGVSHIEFSDALQSRYENLMPQMRQPIVLYIAYFGSETNVSALKWYLENVHPIILQEVPGYRLQIVGRGDLSLFKDRPYGPVEFVGEVPKLAPYIQNAKVGIAPALNGGGFRGKINQYAIFGVPVVASRLAAEGLAYQNGEDIFIADHAFMFGKLCIRLLLENDVNRAMGLKARDTVFAHYTWDSRIDIIKNIYNL